MTVGRAPSWRSGALIAAGAASSLMPLAAQLLFAAGAVGILGLPHGASDLAIVAPERRPSFLLAYVAAIAAVMILWIAAPLAGLTGFLALSAVHFATDGRAGEHRAADWATGSLLVAGPALLHRAALAGLFESVLSSQPVAAWFATLLQAIALVALVPVARALHRGEQIVGSSPAQVVIAFSAMLIFPPLVGFACGFVLLHARGQTWERCTALRCVGLGAYLTRVAPVLLGAVAVLAGLVWLLSRAALDGTATLFACIAALAVPHMLVTPLWQRTAERRLQPATVT